MTRGIVRRYCKVLKGLTGTERYRMVPKGTEWSRIVPKKCTVMYRRILICTERYQMVPKGNECSGMVPKKGMTR